MKRLCFALLFFTAFVIPKQSNAQTGNWQWADSISSSFTTPTYNSSFLDSTGNTFIISCYSVGVSYEKISPGGTRLSTRLAFCPYPYLSIMNNSGRIYVLGYLDSGWNYFGIDSIYTQYYYFYYLACFDTSGNFHWAKTIGTGGTDFDIPTIALDKNGGISLVGLVDDYNGNRMGNYIYFGKDSIYYNNNSYDYNSYIAHFDTSGNYKWAKIVEDDENSSSYGFGPYTPGILVDSAGNTVVSVQYVDVYGSESLGSIVRYNNTGIIIMVKFYGLLTKISAKVIIIGVIILIILKVL